MHPKYRPDTFRARLQPGGLPELGGDPMRAALRDLRRKRSELDAAIESILQARPDLRDDEQHS
jgi:hypothetical protein